MNLLITENGMRKKMSKKTKDTTVDIDYADQAVPKEGRKVS